MNEVHKPHKLTSYFENSKTPVTALWYVEFEGRKEVKVKVGAQSELERLVVRISERIDKPKKYAHNRGIRRVSKTKVQVNIVIK